MLTRWEDQECEKDQFYNDKVGEWDLQDPGKVVLGVRDFNRHLGRRINGFEGVHGRYVMKCVERSLGAIEETRTSINLNEMQFGFVPGKETVDAIFIVRRMQEEYQKKDKK